MAVYPQIWGPFGVVISAIVLTLSYPCVILLYGHQISSNWNLLYHQDQQLSVKYHIHNQNSENTAEHSNPYVCTRVRLCEMLRYGSTEYGLVDVALPALDSSEIGQPPNKTIVQRLTVCMRVVSIVIPNIKREHY